MDTENKAKLDYELTDYGKLLFEYNSKGKESVLYMSSEKRKANFKSPFFYYVLSIPLILIAWFIASIVSVFSLEEDERWLRLGLTLASLIPVAIISVIAIMLAFGFWGKLYDWKIRGLYNKKEDYLRIYDDYVVIKKDGETSVYRSSSIKSVEVNWNCYIRFNFRNFSKVFYLEIPQNETNTEKLERIFKDKITIVKSTRYYEPVRFKFSADFVIRIIFTLIALGVGVGVICMRVYTDIYVPYLFSAMFIGGGLILICDSLSFIPFVKDIVMPFMASAFVIVIHWWLTATLHELWHLGEGIKAFTVLTPFTCVAVLMSSIGVMGVVKVIVTIMDYIRYGHKLGKL